MLHIVAWCLLGLLMVWVFGAPGAGYGYGQTAIFVLLFLPILAGATYLILNVLVPRYLLKRRFYLFALYSVYTLVTAAWIELMIAVGMFAMVYEYNVELLNPRITDLGYLTGIMFLVILPAAAIQITRQWYREREVNDRLKQEKLELELYARKKELDYLKEQMHPHFLFNVLNNLYGLTLEKSDKAPELVLKVSSMLDYMLYRSSDDRVPLSGELQHIADYLEIQKIRCGDRLTVNLQLDAVDESLHIAPMILLPFVENSFKHGVARASGQAVIDISLKVVEESIIFSVSNSLSRQTGNQSGPGVGLQNVQKRLNLLYGEAYQLNINETDQEFGVLLKLPVRKESYETMDLHDRG